jgi:8-oxo-dGTP pyrophosphatase MutT (NUDIX family)
LSDVSVARPSSTVVLARQTDDGPELLLVRRHARSSFGGAYAFPGGVLEHSDSDVERYCAGIDDRGARDLLDDDDALAYYSAAIRELFEESGVLLATVADDGCDLDVVREDLNSGGLVWSDFLEQNGVRLQCDALHYFSFWITPEVFKARYSTRFFVAAMPDDQQAVHCGGELTDSRWISAAEALRAQSDGELQMHFPTVKTLESLAGLETVEEMLAWASDRAAEGVPCIFPRIGDRDGAARVIVDGRDAGALK